MLVLIEKQKALIDRGFSFAVEKGLCWFVKGHLGNDWSVSILSKVGKLANEITYKKK